ncbi:13622_t:CDS:1, partial [Dentiscutata heterogama]
DTALDIIHIIQNNPTTQEQMTEQKNMKFKVTAVATEQTAKLRAVQIIHSASDVVYACITRLMQ